ncbi:type II secretion system F family protein [Terrilactibacillus sp. BCM23-1]|uniref:Type II secretion system F family protein n=1 Tax=Terrilactibacillus tamarindi TaxID=2599694 RepID=A0A6N8CQ11_9BACI|nr:type II secretion system F family protein [Terrilactibacillus tamarindi]MTT31748.1 type II secretion system F family protein [Terrilactibacillus tamarindi]
MPFYEYVGMTPSGKLKRGRLEAENKQQAGQRIVDKGLIIQDVSERKPNLLMKDIAIFHQVKLQEKVVFLRQFATIIKAGVTVAETLQILADQETKNRYFKSIIEDMSDELEMGHALSDAFEKYPSVFSPMIVQMIRAGETSGRLEESLNHLATFYEKQHQSRQKMTTAMIYPLFVLAISILVVAFLLISIIPMFKKMFSGLHQQMPAVTQLTLSISDWMRHDWYIWLGFIFLFIFLIVLLHKNKSSKYWLDDAIIKLPIIGQLVYKSELSRVLWMLSLLLSSSVPVIEALKSIERITSNLAIQRAIKNSSRRLESGISLSEAFKSEPIFPGIIHHMTAIGERTGTLDAMLDKVSKYYEDDVSRLLERMKALIEPVLMLVLAIVVGFIVMSIVVPMFQIYQNM